MIRKTIPMIAATVGVMALLVGCAGGTPAPEPTEPGTTLEGPAALVPADVRATGELRIGNSPVYPPMSYLPEGEEADENRIGFDVDLGTAIAEVLELTPVFERQPYEQYIPSLGTGRLDVVHSAMQDLEERRTTVDFVDYYFTGPQIFTTADRTDLTDVTDLCGGTIILDVGDVGYQDAVNTLSDEICGDNPIEIVPAAGTAEALLQLQQGRADATVRGAESVRYLMSELEPGVYALVGEPIAEIPVGIAVAKTNTELRDAVAAAMQVLIDNGTYQAIGEKWGLQDILIPAAMINGEEI